MWRVAVGQDRLDDQQLAVRFHDPAAMTEDREALLLAPVVNDVRKDVSVATGRSRLEEISGLDAHTIHHAFGFEQCGGVIHDMRPIEQHATRPGMAREYGGKHVAGRASYIHNGFEG